MLFRVPAALDEEGRIVLPDQVEDEALLECIACGTKVSVRQSTSFPRCFYHHGPSNCGREPAARLAATERLAEVIDQWLRGEGPAPSLRAECSDPNCGRSFERPLERGDYTSVVVQKRIGADQHIDVALLNDKEMRMAVDIRVTKAVDQDKEEYLSNAGIRLVELDAEAVLREPLYWQPINLAAGPHSPCIQCHNWHDSMANFGIPAWVHRLREDAPGERTVQIWRRGRELQLAKAGVFNIVVAKLERFPSGPDWTTELRRARHEAHKATADSALPPHTAWFFILNHLLSVFGGKWTTPLDQQWHGTYEHVEAPLSSHLDSAANQQELRRIAQETGQPLFDPQSPYSSVPHRCWHPECWSELLVYRWIGKRKHDVRRPPPDQPSTVQFRATEQHPEKYWANVCPTCGAVQGDNHLYDVTGPPTPTSDGAWGAANSIMNQFMSKFSH